MQLVQANEPVNPDSSSPIDVFAEVQEGTDFEFNFNDSSDHICHVSASLPLDELSSLTLIFQTNMTFVTESNFEWVKDLLMLKGIINNNQKFVYKRDHLVDYF